MSDAKQFSLGGDLIKMRDAVLLDGLANVGEHNAIFRGKNLGNTFTSAQKAVIQDGTFEDLYIGDYWEIGSVKYRIAAFDYWLHDGDTECTSHHVVIVPDSSLDTQKMNDSNITTGGYVGSKMYTDYLAGAKATIKTAFGAANILSHRELYVNTVTDGKASNWSWYDSEIDLMNEVMVYGCNVFASAPGYETGIDKTQLPLFALRPDLITNRATWWLRSVCSATYFCGVADDGLAYNYGASYAHGVRPAFAIF